MHYWKKKYLAILFWLSPILLFSDTSKEPVLKRGYLSLETGYYFSHQGKKQHINIEGLIGDEFTVTDHSSGNGLVGLGVFLKGLEKKWGEVDFGVNVFYLPKTSVKGNVVQENLFTNLSYQYKVSHIPIYAAFNTKINTGLPKCKVNLNVGIGPNILRASNFKETPLNDYTLADQIFSSKTQAVLSATAGATLEFYQILGPLSLDLGYRFFYLGKGYFKTTSSEVENPLSTGNCYGNAIVFSLKI